MPQRVAVLAFDRISPFHLCVPSIVLGEAAPHFDVRVVAMESGPLHTTAGFSIATDHGLERLALADVVVVPTWRDVHERAPEAVLQALRADLAHTPTLDTVAQQPLETSDAPLESVVTQCGLGSAQNLRLQSRKVLGLTPQQWRRQFRGTWLLSKQ